MIPYDIVTYIITWNWLFDLQKSPAGPSHSLPLHPRGVPQRNRCPARSQRRCCRATPAVLCWPGRCWRMGTLEDWPENQTRLAGKISINDLLPLMINGDCCSWGNHLSNRNKRFQGLIRQKSGFNQAKLRFDPPKWEFNWQTWWVYHGLFSPMFGDVWSLNPESFRFDQPNIYFANKHEDVLQYIRDLSNHGAWG